MNSIKRLKNNRIGLSMVFLITGLANGLFFSNLPYFQDKLEVSYSLISMALLSATFGSIPSLFFAGYLIGKFGSKVIISITAIAYSLILALLFLAPSYYTLLAFLFLNGFCVGFLDVAMNSRAVKVEEAYGKSIMSSFHAFYSIAGFIAAGWTKVALLKKMDFSIFIGISSSTLFLISLISIRYLKDFKGVREKNEKSEIITLPKGALIGIAALVFLAFISEGAIGDWSALFLNKEQGLNKATAALGFGLFNIFMAIGRTFGDFITRKMGKVNTLKISGLYSAIILSCAIFIPSPKLSLVFIGLLGIGMANFVPILFSAAGNSGIMSPSKGIASVSMIGYLGFIIGPPLLGFIGDLILLRYAFLVIVFFSLVISFSSNFFLKRSIEGNDQDDLNKKVV